MSAKKPDPLITSREYRVLKATHGKVISFYNKHKKVFVSANTESPKRINNHIALNEALKIMKEYKDAQIDMRLTINYL